MATKKLKVQRVVQLAMPEGQGVRLLLHPVLLSLLASSTKKSPTGPGTGLFLGRRVVLPKLQQLRPDGRENQEMCVASVGSSGLKKRPN